MTDDEWRASIERRLEAIERQLDLRVADAEPRPADAESGGSTLALLGERIGRSLIILGGAYLLRAITQAAFLPDIAGIALALLYALYWIRRAQVFDAGTGAVIAFALAWESSTRFHVIDAKTAAAIVTLVAGYALYVATNYGLRLLAWGVATGASVALIAIAAGTRELAPCAAGAAVVTVVCVLCKFEYVQFAPGVMLDLMLIVLTATTAIGAPERERVLAAAILLGAMSLYFATLVWKKNVETFDSAQLGALVVIALAGTAVLLMPFAIPRLVAGVVVLLLATASYWLSASRIFLVCGVAFALFGSFLALGREAAVIAWSVAAIVLVARGFAVQGSVYAGAAFAGSGLFVFTVGALVLKIATATWLVIVTFIAIAIATVLARNTALVAMSTASAAAMLVTLVAPLLQHDAARIATLRTFLFGATAVAFGRFPQTRRLVHAVLIAGALKLIAEDFRVGAPATLFLSLAIYGGALVFAARARRGYFLKERISPTSAST